jgi:hypothetical protein
MSSLSASLEERAGSAGLDLVGTVLVISRLPVRATA